MTETINRTATANPTATVDRAAADRTTTGDHTATAAAARAVANMAAAITTDEDAYRLVYESPFGPLVIVGDDESITHLFLPNTGLASAGGSPGPIPKAVRQATTELDEYFAGHARRSTSGSDSRRAPRSSKRSGERSRRSRTARRSAMPSSRRGLAGRRRSGRSGRRTARTRWRSSTHATG